MMNNKTLSMAAVALLCSTAQAFVTDVNRPLSSTTTSTQRNALSFNNQQDVLSECNLPGNFHFDPLHLAQSQEQLVTYRKAEMKHARLAILAVLSILWSDCHVVDTLGATPLIEGRAFPEFLGACVGLPAAIELYAEQVELEHANDSTYFPGQLDLDPFHLYPATTQEQRRVQFAEIMTGRLCMLVAAGRLMESMLASMGILGEEESLVSLLMPVQSTVETLDDVLV